MTVPTVGAATFPTNRDTTFPPFVLQFFQTRWTQYKLLVGRLVSRHVHTIHVGYLGLLNLLKNESVERIVDSEIVGRFGSHHLSAAIVSKVLVGNLGQGVNGVFLCEGLDVDNLQGSPWGVPVAEETGVHVTVVFIGVFVAFGKEILQWLFGIKPIVVPIGKAQQGTVK
mgnify:FL=1